jgi:hypothetical protein
MMERQQILATMGELKLFGMKAAYDEIIKCQRAPKSPQLWAFKIPWPAGSVRIGDQPAV